jgi:hypothetical protein
MAAESLLRFETSAGLVVQDWAQVGPAGGAWLRPAPDIELVFDRLSGELCCLAISGGPPGSPWTLSEPAAAFLNRLCGPRAADQARRVAGRQRAAPGLIAGASLSGALSALACLRAARATSPVPASPWWDAEEAQLAQSAGFADLAQAAADAAVRALAVLASPQLAGRQAAAARSAADIAQTAETAAANLVRELVRGAAIQPAGACQTVPLEESATWPGDQQVQDQAGSDLTWMLDLTLVTAGLFLPALWPEDDLAVVLPSAAGDSIAVTAQLAPGADRDALRNCRARLVLPPQQMLAGRVVAEGFFTSAGSRAVTEVPLPSPGYEPDGAWIEIVSGDVVPVHTRKYRLGKRALRWGDAALRAEQRPRGLAPRFSGRDWLAFAAAAWQGCRDDWDAAGDSALASLAAQRLAAIDADAPLARRRRAASIAEDYGP